MFSKAVAAVALVVVRTSGIPCRAGAVVHSPLSPALAGSSDSLFDEAAARNNETNPHAGSPGAFQQSIPQYTGPQRPEYIVTQAGDNNCAIVVRDTSTTAVIVQPAA